jgi:FdhE protein
VWGDAVQRILEPGQIETLDQTSIPRIRLVDRHTVFSTRAKRLKQLAANGVAGIPVDPTFSGYLTLMALVADAQHTVLSALDARITAASADVDQALIQLGQQHSMPILPASGRRSPVWQEVFDAVLAEIERRVMQQSEQQSKPQPERLPAANAAVVLQTLARLRDLRTSGSAALDAAADALLSGVIAPDAGAAPFLYAALQVYWSDRVDRLSEGDVPFMDHAGDCPVCGSQTVASVVRIGAASHGYRYLQCGLCATESHVVRVKCTICASTGKIAYRGLVGKDVPAEEDDPGAPGGKRQANDPARFAKAESCDDCHGYRKIFYQEHDYEVEPLADDLASLSLDVLMAGEGYTRAAGNPLIWFDEFAP